MRILENNYLLVNILSKVIGSYISIPTDLCVVGTARSVSDDTTRLSEHSPCLVARRRGRAAQHSQASPAEDY